MSEVILHFTQRGKRHLLSSFNNEWLFFEILYMFNNLHEGNKSPKYHFRTTGAKSPWKPGRLHADGFQTPIYAVRKEEEQQTNFQYQQP